MRDLEPGICWQCSCPVLTKIEKNLWICPKCGWKLDCRACKPKPKKKPKRIGLKNLSAYLDYLGD